MGSGTDYSPSTCEIYGEHVEQHTYSRIFEGYGPRFCNLNIKRLEPGIHNLPYKQVVGLQGFCTYTPAPKLV